jgi:CubicO group peptidase (beta-lactamase class C family)
MRRDTVFDLASLTKLFTALVAVREVERGTFGLDDRVAAHLPQFAEAGKERITVRHLLTHTSGLRAELPFHACPTRERRDELLWREAPLHPPGTAPVYSDLNLIALQWLLERITGHGLDTLVEVGITGPLGMTSTRFAPPSSWKSRIAATEDQRKPWGRLDRGLVHGEVHDENAHAFGGVSGHAGLFSDARDLGVLCRALLAGGTFEGTRILAPESVELLLSDAGTATGAPAHGLGFELDRPGYQGALAGPRTAGHTGFTGTCLILDRDTGAFLVLLTNAVHPYRGWSTNEPRVAAANHLARAVGRPTRPVR